MESDPWVVATLVTIAVAMRKERLFMFFTGEGEP